jgi:hypothetical protein
LSQRKSTIIPMMLNRECAHLSMLKASPNAFLRDLALCLGFRGLLRTLGIGTVEGRALALGIRAIVARLTEQPASTGVERE